MRTVAMTRTPEVAARLTEVAEEVALEVLEAVDSLTAFVEAASYFRPQCLFVEVRASSEVGAVTNMAAAGRPVAMVIVAETTEKSERSTASIVLSRRVFLREDAQARAHVVDRIANFLERHAAVSRWTRSSRELSRELDEFDLEGLDLDDL